jgi:sugar-specific transcriptional regulator TrmB
MLVKQELISRIKDYFDLNVYETKVWLALLGKGIASAGEVAGISGVPRSRTYDVLENLEKKGFAIAKLGKPAKYIGVKPRIMLEKLENNLRNDVEKKITTFSNIKETKEFKQLEELYKKSSNPIKKENISVALEGKSNISGYLKEIIRNAKKEVIICTDAEDMNSKIRLFHKTFEILQKAGIKVKVALSGDENLIKQLRINLKIKIKKADIDAKFFIIDRREILFYLSKNTNKEDIAIWLNSEFFSNAFAFLFEKTLI